MELLNQEISFAQSEEQRTGWTLWAVAGALAALLLLGLDTLETAGLDLSLTAKWILVIAMPVDVIVNYLWTWTVHSAEPRRIYRFLHEFEHQQVAYGWRTIHSLALLMIALNLREGVWTPAVVVAVLWYAMLVLVSFLIIPFISAELPYIVKPSLSKARMLILGAGFAIVVLASAGFYARTLPTLNPGTQTTELRLALVTVTASYLFFRLLLGLRQPWQIRRLVSLRRELALGRIDVGEAISATHVALVSGGAQHALEEHLRKTMALSGEARECSAKAQRLITEFAPTWLAVHEQWEGLSAAKRQKELSRAEDSLDQINQATLELRKWLERIKRRLIAVNQHYDRMLRESPASFTVGMESINALYRRCEEEHVSLIQIADWVDEQVQGVRDQRQLLERQVSAARG